ncbi:MAG: hypothetical protein EOM14_15720 [Clostridia bacterium]|nr:hypothetical protein [Clostridia bacterium]
MSWIDCLKYAIYALGAIILLLWLFNFYRALRKKSDCVLVRRLMYSLAILVIGLSIARSSQLYGSAVVFANITVLLCIIVAFYRSEQKPADEREE